MAGGEVLDPRFLAGVKLLERTGMREFQIRYDDDQAPVVWVAVGQWFMDRRTRRPRAELGPGAAEIWQAAAAMNGTAAVLRLCDQVLDGGTCTHCGRPTGVESDEPGTMPLDSVICWYQFDPELAVYRRGCE